MMHTIFMPLRLKTEIILVAIIFFHLAAAYQRNMIWSSELTLWKDTTVKSPFKARPHMNLGIEYNEREDTQKALQELDKALSLKPRDARIYNNFGTVYIKTKNYQQALEYFTKALEIRPQYSHAHHNLGTVYLHFKKYPEAIKCFEKALILKPFHFPQLWGLELRLMYFPSRM